ncbi:MAG: M48 family metallopeptidase [Planctomycetaceae bacterium]
MTDLKYRCEGDLALYNELLETDEVKQATRRLEDNPGAGVRRQLLATALRLTDKMSPTLHGLLEDSIKELKVEIPVEVYVYNSPQFNAACLAPENDRLLLMFSSSLLEKFVEDEIRFVMGHELGHHLCGHTEIPIGYLIDGPEPVGPRLAMKLFSWSRYAEISADRAGAICAKDANATANALFKLASGLTTNLIQINIDDFAAQVDEMAVEEDDPSKRDKNERDWFMTHPFSPLRVKALQQFFRSEIMTKDGTSIAQLESETHTLMEIMSPTYLKEKSEAAEAMRRVLFAAGCGVMAASGGISDKEVEAFNNLFGDGSFTEKLDLERLEESLEERVRRANDVVPHARRVHIIRDLCLIAVASGRVTRKEREYVHRVAKMLTLSATITEHCFNRSSDLD